MSSVAQVGMDVHKDTIRIALYPEGGTTFLDERTLRNEKGALLAYLLKWADRYELHCYYEASSCGYLVHRWLTAHQIRCTVIAPSKTPRTAGEPVKTDRRDARMLAQQGRAGALSPIAVPSPEDEAVRGLVHQYEAQRQHERATKLRVQMWLLQRGQYYQAGDPWTQQHWRWLKALRFPGVDGEVFAEYLAEVIDAMNRTQATARRLQTLAETPLYRQRVHWLCCFRGITPVRALIVLIETLDFTRFPGAEQYMGYTGLVSRESSSGSRRRQGSITKAGSALLRYELIEAAWSYQHPPRVGPALKKRQAAQPPEAIAMAWRAQKRLHQLYWRLVHRKKDTGLAAVAVARELAGFIWAMMTTVAATAA